MSYMLNVNIATKQENKKKTRQNPSLSAIFSPSVTSADYQAFFAGSLHCALAVTSLAPETRDMAEQENPMTKLLGYRKDDTDDIFWLVLYKNGKEDWKTDKEVRENEKCGELSCRISIPNRHSLGELTPPYRSKL
eukprot:g19373.t1